MAVIKLEGHLTLSTYDGKRLTNRQTASNVVCANGLADLAAAVGWAGAQDQGSLIGASSSFLTPLYGAIGTGTNPPYTFTGTLTSGSDTITGISPMPAITSGMMIQGTGIPTATQITAVGSSTLTLSYPVTVSGSESLTAGTSPTDSILYNELSRSTVTAVAASPNSPGASTTWQFQFGLSQTAQTITEAGLFCLASATSGSGDLLDHALFVPEFSWPALQSLTLTADLDWWYQ